LLTLANGATGEANSYIYVPVAILNATGNETFPIGKSSYRPVTTNSITGSSPTIQFEVYDTTPTYSFDAPIVNISSVRYWLGAINSGSISGGQVTLTYGSDDGVIEFNEQGDVIVARASGSSGPYASLGGQASGSAPNGTVTSTGVLGTSLGYFTLGSSTGDNPLPVELLSFEANANFSNVSLTWGTASEFNNLGFNIYRAKVNEDWEKINTDLIAGQGTVSSASDYSYVDSKVVAGETYRYKLESVSINGLSVEEKTVDVTVPVPNQYALFNNYPNPFNPTTNIKFQLPEAQQVKLYIYDMNGSLVNTLANNQVYPSGEHILTWNATDKSGNRVATGIYLYRFQAGKFVRTGKMILVK
ncbi:MAG: T9SS type A sorting domain-containing protein, partial [Calditrichaceae bacterium]